MSFIENKENELVYMTSSVIKARHAFTTRYGGVSEGIFSSLNLGSNRGDDPDAVRENYRRVCALMGVGIDEAAVTKQVHGSVVRVVTGEDRHVCMSTVPYEADGLVTAERGLPLMCFTADCVPALLCDSVHGVIAAVHCGWRSSVGDILGNAVKEMCALGARPETICCALGPAIGSCCFETDNDVPQAIEAYLGGETGGFSAAAPTARRLWICAAPTRGGSCSWAFGKRTSTSRRNAPSAATTNTGRTATPADSAGARRPSSS